jgi:hypothetical protein
MFESLVVRSLRTGRGAVLPERASHVFLLCRPTVLDTVVSISTEPYNARVPLGTQSHVFSGLHYGTVYGTVCIFFSKSYCAVVSSLSSFIRRLSPGVEVLCSCYV